ncbi:MAG: glycosyltransferase [Cytophagales bacterium]|nr:glycosyltransferase [Cytophaga sp.]
MKVLWFTPTPSLAEGHLNDSPVGGGWIKSLEKSIQNTVDLSVAFYHKKNIAPFKYNNTSYFPIKKSKSSTLLKIKKRIFSQLESEDDIAFFLKIIEEVKPDILHIHGTEFMYGLVQQYSKIPTVISIQGNISVYTYKYFSGISFLDVLKYSRMKTWLSFQTAINDYFLFRKQTIREQRIFSMSRNFIGRTDWDRRISSILSPGSSYFHNDEILRDSFYTAQWKNTLHPVLNLFTTNGPTIYKGIETILYCASLLDRNNIRFNWQIAGIERTDEIVTIAAKGLGVNISEHLEFLGKVSEERLVEQLLKTHIYIATSHIENSPNSLCEALLLGVPCIATNAGGTSSLIKDGADGIVIQDGDPYVMAGAIIEMQKNYMQAIAFGISARTRALLRHNKETIATGLIAIYAKIIKGN